MLYSVHTWGDIYPGQLFRSALIKAAAMVGPRPRKFSTMERAYSIVGNDFKSVDLKSLESQFD